MRKILPALPTDQSQHEPCTNSTGKASAKIRWGFTLIELIIVMSLIGALAAIALVNFQGAQRDARDAQRRSDLKQYQISLESYANSNNGFYPARPAAAGVGASTTLCTDLGSNFMASCLEDPWQSTDGRVYSYQSNGTDGNDDATRFVLWAQLEKTTNTWVVCSNGQTGLDVDPLSVSGGNCPL